jgi:alkylation response protein AidB-like acyl-CoA dehydrogenase
MNMTQRCRLGVSLLCRIFAGTSEIMKQVIGRSLGLDERKMV